MKFADLTPEQMEQFKQFKRYERENAELNQQIRAMQQQDAADNQLRQWWQQGEQLKQQYPSFDLDREAQNPEFLRLLRSGVPVDHAFKLLHMDEIMQGVREIIIIADLRHYGFAKILHKIISFIISFVILYDSRT